MNNANKIRQSAEEAKELIKKAIEWGNYPGSINNALDALDKILDLLPCETCGGTGKKMADGYFEMVHKEIPCPDCT